MNFFFPFLFALPLDSEVLNIAPVSASQVAKLSQKAVCTSLINLLSPLSCKDPTHHEIKIKKNEEGKSETEEDSKFKLEGCRKNEGEE